MQFHANLPLATPANNPDPEDPIIQSVNNAFSELSQRINAARCQYRCYTAGAGTLAVLGISTMICAANINLSRGAEIGMYMGGGLAIVFGCNLMALFYTADRTLGIKQIAFPDI